MIAALYVETNGVYYGLPDVDPWDEARDARLYEGPWPVVAHPPCQRWCRFAKQVEQLHDHKVGDDGGTFEAALDAVRRYGGVLEHPAGSLAWNAFDLPKPQSSRGWTASLTDTGWSCYVEQGRYGLPMRKQTWLYAYGLASLPSLRWGRRIDSEGGTFKWGSYLYKGAPNHERPRLSAAGLAKTPPSFRDELLTIARCVRDEFPPVPLGDVTGQRASPRGLGAGGGMKAAWHVIYNLDGSFRGYEWALDEHGNKRPSRVYAQEGRDEHGNPQPEVET